MRSWRPNWSHVQDAIYFLTGLGIVIHDTLLTSLDREWLLLLAAGAMGLPGFRRLDRRRNRDQGEDDGS